MMKKQGWKVILLAFCLAISLNCRSSEFLNQLPFSSGETLHYKLSYRGLLTSMIRADIADARMTFLANRKTPEQKNGHQFVLSLSTKNYLKAEMIQAVRYTYTTTLDDSLQRTLLVEEMDTGENQSHDFLWIDWQNKETQLYKKREKKRIKSDFLGLESYETWEKEGAQGIPDFLNHFPSLEGNLSYLIYDEFGAKIEHPQILDPLALIYSLRSQNFRDNKEVKEIPIAVSDDIRLYRVKKSGLEIITIAKQMHQTTKYIIQTDEKKDNYYAVWLSNDKQKLPLRLAMDAPLGKLEINLLRITQSEDSRNGLESDVISSSFH